MYCSQCGKRIKDTMRFCPFCGAQAELPEQEETKAPRTFSEQLRRDDSGVFIPLSMDESVWNVPDAEPEKAEGKKAEPEQVAPKRAEPEPEKPVRRGASDVKQPMARVETREQAEAKARAAVEELELPPRRRAHEEQPTQTYTVQRRFDPQNIFFDESDDEDEDDEEYAFEDEEDRSFLSRHIRGFVALVLVLILVLVGAFYLYSANGQRLLARFGFAWRPEAIANVAHEDYLNGRYAQAASGYAQALSLDPDSYDYARNASIMYYSAGDRLAAADMAKRAIAIDPNQKDPYDMLRMIYADGADMPDDVKALLGVETGEGSKVNTEE